MADVPSTTPNIQSASFTPDILPTSRIVDLGEWLDSKFQEDAGDTDNAPKSNGEITKPRLLFQYLATGSPAAANSDAAQTALRALYRLDIDTEQLTEEHVCFVTYENALQAESVRKRAPDQNMRNSEFLYPRTLTGFKTTLTIIPKMDRAADLMKRQPLRSVFAQIKSYLQVHGFLEPVPRSERPFPPLNPLSVGLVSDQSPRRRSPRVWQPFSPGFLYTMWWPDWGKLEGEEVLIGDVTVELRMICEI